MRTNKLLLIGSVLLAACTAPPIMKQSETHVSPAVAEPQGSIPAPIAISPTLSRPKQIQKPETYSVVVNGVKVHELLFALARDAKLNIDIHNGIAGTVTMNAIDQTLPQLLTRISKQVDMRWEFDAPNLIVMPDSPFLRVYKIDYVNMERTMTSSMNVSSNLSGGGGSGGGGGGGGGGASGGGASSTSLQNSSANRFWRTLVENVKDILKETDKIVQTGSTPAAAPTPAPAPAPVAVPAAAGIAAALLGGAAGQPAPQAAAPSGPPSGTPNTEYREAASVIPNAEAGVMVIRATGRQHEKIQEFLDRVLVNARRQVMIEATIVEVQLNNQFQQGINWSLLRRGSLSTSPGTTTPNGISLTQAPVGGLASTPTQSLFVGTLTAPAFNLGSLSATISLLESFGNVRVLSSPKMSVLNNQTALIKVVDDVVYFNISSQQSSSGTAGTVIATFTATKQTEPVGFVMNVTPQIGDTDIVLLNLRPTLTRIARFVQDPTPTLGVPNLIPEIRRREMESMIRVNSGQIAVMGGLIQEQVSDQEDGIPGLRASEGLGQLFGQRNRSNTKTELVVFLRPIVIRDPSIDGDYRSYRVYAPDEYFLNQPNPGTFPAEARQ